MTRNTHTSDYWQEGWEWQYWHGGCDCDKEVETKNTDMEIVSNYEVARDMEFVADNSDEEVETKYIGMEVRDH